MQVYELMAILAGYPANAEVYLDLEDENFLVRVKEVESAENENAPAIVAMRESED